MDEKSQTQALGRCQPVLPMMPGLPERRSHDYVRAGTTTLFAALAVATGKVSGSLHRRDRAVEFKKFLAKVDKEAPADLEVHLILDNYATHKTASMTTAEWVRMKPPHLPKSGRRGGRWAGHRRIINEILSRHGTGVPRRDLPARFGPWKTTYERHRRWSADGAWDEIFAAVLADADAEGRINWSMVSLDSTSCRAHQHGAGARRRAPRVAGKKGAPRQQRPDEGLGRSRGGLTSKIHLAGDGGRRPWPC